MSKVLEDATMQSTMATAPITLRGGPRSDQMQQYVDQQTRRALVLRDAGMSVKAIAAHLGHPYSTVRAWLDAFVVDENAMSREEDLSIMEELLTEARAMVKKRYRLVNAG